MMEACSGMHPESATKNPIDKVSKISWGTCGVYQHLESVYGRPAIPINLLRNIMSKINLIEAREMLEDIVLIDVFASLVSSSLEEDYEKLRLHRQLTDKIYNAEKHFNIDDMRNQLHLMIKEENYYAPENAVFYYKDKITNEIKESNNDIYAEILSSINVLKKKIAEISEHVYIEVN